MSWRAGLVALVVVFAASAGAAAGAPPGPRPGPGTPVASGTSEAVTNHTPADPETDVLGWEDGYWHNESIDVDQSDGLSEAELDAYVARAMARVEVIREREFKSRVPVTVIARETYRQQLANQTEGANFTAWNNQVWEALFIVGERDDVQQELDTVAGTSVVGFYSPADDAIKVITETPAEPVLDNATLIHELVHALQDQYYNLSQPKYRGSTQDTQLATDGLIEGEANYVQRTYAQRCGEDWSCVASPGRSAGGSGGNLGILLTLLNPYSDGPVYISSLLEAGGWSAVDDAFMDPPASTEQIIHRTDEPPVPIAYQDEAVAGWTLFRDQGVNGSDTAGEASMFVMFWYQALEYRANTIDVSTFRRGLVGPYDTYNYDVAASAGWGNDRIFPYRNAADNETRYGYVWVTEWDTVADAEEFQETYLRMLEAHGAERVGVRTWVVPDGPFADSFRVGQNGSRVTVVNGPTNASLAELRPSLAYQPLSTPTSSQPTPTETVVSTRTATPMAPTIVTPGQPGFGPAVGLLAVLLAVWWRRRG